jgi:hypothetical protein
MLLQLISDVCKAEIQYVKNCVALPLETENGEGSSTSSEALMKPRKVGKR